jgi:hypothetical protein
MVTLRSYGAFSFNTAGVFCLTMYSLPALLGLVYPFDSPAATLQLAPASAQAVAATTLAWIVFTLVLATPACGTHAVHSNRLIPLQSFGQPDRSAFIAAAMMLSVGGFLVIAVLDGPFFFLEMREEGSEGLVRMLWRWVNAIGLIAAVYARSWKAVTVFVIGILVYFLSGDRTVVVISAFCLLVAWGRGRRVTALLRPRLIVGLMFLVSVALFGKPIYLAIKLGSFDLLVGVATADGWMERLALTFEPFTTFNILEMTIRHDFHLPFWSVFQGAMGQFLLVPSYFGVDANDFNAEFTKTFVPRLRYGIAGNYWAQGWAIGGALGVAIYAAIYATALRLSDRLARQPCSAIAIFGSVIGGLLAVYAHRNALDNLMSFVRQIALVFLILVLMVQALRPFFRTSGNPKHFDISSARPSASRVGTR